ncbi:MAG: methylase involved in ubiquinone/menaquinone biosynthesi [Parcubacteria group bacterium Gr01-1014_17]|nr:MAG: methylase involved in ubiquinone/menaquinone biosynthesi [Parcubacteria group bacterium Gr01-1014_17]
MFSNPQKIISQLDLQSGSRVADVGAGSGAYALAAAKAVGEHGKVFAVEVQKELLSRLEREARSKSVHNIEAVWGDAEQENGTHLASGACDAAIIANILFQALDKTGLAREAARIIKPRGRALVVDWSGSFGGAGPAPSAVVSKQKAQEVFESAGLAFEREIAAGSNHYAIIFRKP